MPSPSDKKITKPGTRPPAAARRSAWYMAAMEHLADVLTELSHAHTLDAVTEIVRNAARNLTGADGATFVLRDGDFCYYADENAISPLWKGQRFPMKTCISGWVMMNAEPVVIEDIYKDARIPVDAYRPTFVKSLAMVPIRADKPIGAIGNYWAQTRVPDDDELAILQILANLTSVAMENVALYEQLQHKVRALEVVNDELGRLVWATSHDLKSPLRAIDNLSQWIAEDTQQSLSPESQQHLINIQGRIKRMEKLLDDTLGYVYDDAKRNRLKPELISGDTLHQDVLALVHVPQGFQVEFTDMFLGLQLPRIPLRPILCNLIDNAVRHHDGASGHIRVSVDDEPGRWRFFVKDDGPGIAPQYHEKIFQMFQTLKSRDIREGSGMGLAYVRKILEERGQTISVESATGQGSVFTFTWPKPLDFEEVAA